MPGLTQEQVQMLNHPFTGTEEQRRLIEEVLKQNQSQQFSHKINDAGLLCATSIAYFSAAIISIPFYLALGATLYAARNRLNWQEGFESDLHALNRVYDWVLEASSLNTQILEVQQLIKFAAPLLIDRKDDKLKAIVQIDDSAVSLATRLASKAVTAANSMLTTGREETDTNKNEIQPEPPAVFAATVNQILETSPGNNILGTINSSLYGEEGRAGKAVNAGLALPVTVYRFFKPATPNSSSSQINVHVDTSMVQKGLTFLSTMASTAASYLQSDHTESPKQK